MKKWYFVFLSCLFINCNLSDKLDVKKYYAEDEKGNKGYLKLNYNKEFFYGDYVLQYANKLKDSGRVRGEIKFDTLVGRYSFLSHTGSKDLKPFVLLKEGENLKLGKGKVSVYMKIPFYTKESLTFKDSTLLFKPYGKQ